ncbi:MAG: pseudouridine synthase [Rubricoccaceae bacterium]
MRLNRFLARAGVSSRRGADVLIAEGHVTVNGETVMEMGVHVSPTDRVTVDGKPVGLAGLVYVLLNKPTDTITTVSDDRGRRTVLDVVSGVPQDGLFPVGRLDRDTTGALLLTTDGDLAHRLMHPRYGAVKVYIVTTERPVSEAEVASLKSGVELDDGRAAADHAERFADDPRRVALQLHEGRNRQVRRMIEAIGHSVVSLDRIGYAGLDLDGLRRGRWRHLQPHEVNTLRRSVKLKSIVFRDEE